MKRPDGSEETFGYDRMGNRLVRATHAGQKRLTYGNLNELLSDGPVTYRYDADGQPVSRSDGFAYEFDGLGRMTAAQQYTGAHTTPNWTAAPYAKAVYAYDARDNLIQVTSGGSGTGIAALINGTVDFANASRGMKDEEKTELEGKGGSAVEHQVAIDGIAVIVNPANGVEALTMDQLGQIYRGEITNWKDVGGADMEIVLLSRDSSSGTYEYFKEEVVGEDAEYAASAKLLPSTQGIVDETAANEAGIGYIGLGYLADTVKVVAIDGVKASIETAADGSYPISRYLYMYSNGEPNELMQAYLDWILGEEGQQLVVDEGFVPLP